MSEEQEQRRIELVNERYAKLAQELRGLPDPYERFLAGRALFADWFSELRHKPVRVVW